jgi:DNA modification methylase
MLNHENVLVFANGKTNYYKQPTDSKIVDRKLGKSNGKFNPQKKSEHTGKMSFVKKGNPNNILLEKVNPRTVIKFDVPPRSKGTLHPTQKPVTLGRYLIRTYTNEGDLVLDGFCGSGSFLVAAMLEKRNFIGIELDENYCAIARKRLEDTQKDIDSKLSF